MKRILIASLLLISIAAYAIPSRNKPVKVKQSNGAVVTIHKHGDEYINWTTINGNYVIMGEDGNYHRTTREQAVVSWNGGARREISPATATAPCKGKVRFLVLLVEFSDNQFIIENANQQFYKMLNEKSYSDNGGTGSAKDYFTDQSLGQFEPVFDIVGPINVGKKYIGYTANSGMTKNGAPRLVSEACQLIDPEIDFSIYDSDGDGLIDNVFFFFAGYNAAESTSDKIWPHADYVEDKEVILDGVKLYRYACSSELKGSEGNHQAGIGDFCHEFGHVLGLPDFYGAQSTVSSGLGYYSLMHSGCFNNEGNTPPSFSCEERMLLGWMDKIPELEKKTQDIVLETVSKSNGYISPTDNDGEYFYYEYRDGTGWDKPLEPGILIYHVDKSENIVNGKTASFRWQFQYGINDYPQHECFHLIYADETAGQVPFNEYYPEFTGTGWNGKESDYKISSITLNGETASFTVDFTGNPYQDDIFYQMSLCAIDLGDGRWKAGDVFPLKLVVTKNSPTITVWYFDGLAVEDKTVTLTSGIHTVRADFTYDDGSHGSYEAEISVD